MAYAYARNDEVIVELVLGSVDHELGLARAEIIDAGFDPEMDRFSARDVQVAADIRDIQAAVLLGTRRLRLCVVAAPIDTIAGRDRRQTRADQHGEDPERGTPSSLVRVHGPSNNLNADARLAHEVGMTGGIATRGKIVVEASIHAYSPDVLSGSSPAAPHLRFIR